MSSDQDREQVSPAEPDPSDRQRLDQAGGADAGKPFATSADSPLDGPAAAPQQLADPVTGNRLDDDIADDVADGIADG